MLPLSSPPLLIGRHLLATESLSARYGPEAGGLLSFGVGLGCGAANRRWSQAVAYLTEAIIIDPDARRLCLLARIHTCERQWQLAAERYQDALVLEPDLEMAKVGLEQVQIEHEPLPLVTGLL